MRRLAFTAVALTTLAASLRAQGRATELLTEAKALYERLEFERVLPLLRQIVSPASPLEVTRAERAEAYKYLGAAHAIMGRRDSAIVHFRATLEADPFSDLEPTRFTPAQLGMFGEARRRTFAMAARPAPALRVDPRTQTVPFTVVTTHEARLRVHVARLGDTSGVVLWDGDSEGLRELAWSGLDRTGRLAAPGRYWLRVVGRSRWLARVDTTQVYFDLQHDRPALEDTLPDLGPRDLLPEVRDATARRRDFLKGLAVAGGAVVIAGALASDDLGGGRTEAGIVAGAAVLTGLAAFVLGGGDRALTANVEANRRRAAQRQAANDGVRARNLERIAQTILVVTPAAGAEP